MVAVSVVFYTDPDLVFVPATVDSTSVISIELGNEVGVAQTVWMPMAWAMRCVGKGLDDVRGQYCWVSVEAQIPTMVSLMGWMTPLPLMLFSLVLELPEFGSSSLLLPRCIRNCG